MHFICNNTLLEYFPVDVIYYSRPKFEFDMTEMLLLLLILRKTWVG